MTEVARRAGQWVCDLVPLAGCISAAGKADIGYWTVIAAAAAVILLGGFYVMGKR